VQEIVFPLFGVEGVATLGGTLSQFIGYRAQRTAMNRTNRHAPHVRFFLRELYAGDVLRPYFLATSVSEWKFVTISRPFFHSLTTLGENSCRLAPKFGSGFSPRKERETI
jgi:hypothetical protein